MELLPYWVYELVYAIDKYESEHAFPTGANGVKCFFKEIYKIPQEHKDTARNLVPYMEDVMESKKTSGTVLVV